MKRKNLFVYLSAFLIALFSASTFAAGTELSAMAGAVSFSDLILALTTLFGAMASVGVILKGGAIVLRKLSMR
jgi:hypothetical protein